MSRAGQSAELNTTTSISFKLPRYVKLNAFTVLTLRRDRRGARIRRLGTRSVRRRQGRRDTRGHAHIDDRKRRNIVASCARDSSSSCRCTRTGGGGGRRGRRSRGRRCRSAGRRRRGRRACSISSRRLAFLGEVVVGASVVHAVGVGKLERERSS